MADHPALTDRSGPSALSCDRAIFTSLPSPTGEGYRLVAWSGGVRPEERAELTRRSPSHGSLCREDEGGRARLQLRLQATGRLAWGFVRVSGAEHTRRGGGRVWTDFVIADAAGAEQAGAHPAAVGAALAAAPEPDQPVDGRPLDEWTMPPPDAAPGGDAPVSAPAAARLGSLLAEGKDCVVAAGQSAVDVFDAAMAMVPAFVRCRVNACAGLRFSQARGVVATVLDELGPEVVQATRGHGVNCVDLDGAAAPDHPWFSLMERWWQEGRAADGVRLANRMLRGWNQAAVVEVAALCEAIDRAEEPATALDELLARRGAG